MNSAVKGRAPDINRSERGHIRLESVKIIEGTRTVVEAIAKNIAISNTEKSTKSGKLLGTRRLLHYVKKADKMQIENVAKHKRSVGNEVKGMTPSQSLGTDANYLKSVLLLQEALGEPKPVSRKDGELDSSLQRWNERLMARWNLE